MLADIDRLDHLPADRRWRLSPTSTPGAVRAIDVVEARDGALQTAFCPILLAKHFRHELFPAVTTLGHCRIGIRFFQRADPGILLELRVIGAGGRREKIAAGARAVSPLNHVGINQNATQALDSKALDETHSTHVS